MGEEEGRDRGRERTKQALVASATQVFARNGFDGASVDAIADAAGFTKGAVYSNFGSKEELFFAVVDERFRSLLRGFDVGASNGSPPREALLTAAATELAGAYRDEDWALLEIEVLLYAVRHPEARERLARFRRAHLDTLAAFMEDLLRQTGFELTRPAREVAALVMAANAGISQLRISDPDGGHDALFEIFLTVLANAVLE